MSLSITSRVLSLRVHPSQALRRSAPSLQQSPKTPPQKLQQKSQFSTGLPRSSASHGDHYDPPTGWLWGVKPGHKYVKEGWEGLWMYGFFGSLIIASIAYAFKPDTS